MVHNLLSFAHDSFQVVLILKTLRIDLIDILGAGGSRGEPAVGSHYLEAADRCAVTWGRSQFGRDRLAGVLARAGGDLCRQQVRYKAILIGRPDRAVAPQKRCARAFFAAKAE